MLRFRELLISASGTPVWVTSSGYIGSFSDLSSISFQFNASHAKNFSVISGTLPGGLTISSTGLLSGTSTDILGVDTMYSFTIRAYGSNGYSDRSFNLILTALVYSGSVFLDFTGGNDNYSGLAPSIAVASIYKASQIVQNGGTIYVTYKYFKVQNTDVTAGAHNAWDGFYCSNKTFTVNFQSSFLVVTCTNSIDCFITVWGSNNNITIVNMNAWFYSPSALYGVQNGDYLGCKKFGLVFTGSYNYCPSNTLNFNNFNFSGNFANVIYTNASTAITNINSGSVKTKTIYKNYGTATVASGVTIASAAGATFASACGWTLQ